MGSLVAIRAGGGPGAERLSTKIVRKSFRSLLQPGLHARLQSVDRGGRRLVPRCPVSPAAHDLRTPRARGRAQFRRHHPRPAGRARDPPCVRLRSPARLPRRSLSRSAGLVGIARIDRALWVAEIPRLRSPPLPRCSSRPPGQSAPAWLARLAVRGLPWPALACPGPRTDSQVGASAAGHARAQLTGIGASGGSRPRGGGRRG